MAADTVRVVEHAISVHHFTLQEFFTTPQTLSDILDSLVPRVQPLQDDRRPS